MHNNEKQRNSDFQVADAKLKVDARAQRLKDAVRRAGGNLAVSRASGIPLSTLQGYFSGSPMKLDNVIAIGDACGVTLEWLATGRGGASATEDSAGRPGPAYEPSDPVLLSGASAEQALLQAPQGAVLDVAILAKCIEIMQDLTAASGVSMSALASARRIANLYKAMTTPDEDLAPPPHPSPAKDQ